MIKKNITYTDFNGQKRTDEFHFNLTAAEMTEMEMEADGGMSEALQRIIDAKDSREILNVFKMIVRRSVGRRSEDGRKFVKNAEIESDLFDSNAYSEFFMELMTDGDSAVEFVKGVVPAEALERIQAQEQPQDSIKYPVEKLNVSNTPEPKTPLGLPVIEISDDELSDLRQRLELAEAAKRNRK